MALSMPPSDPSGPRRRTATPPNPRLPDVMRIVEQHGKIRRTETPPSGPSHPPSATAPPPQLRTPKPTSAPPPPPQQVAAQKPVAAQSETLQGIYQSLVNAAAELNTASDELAIPIRAYEGALKALNLGVSAWVELSSGGDGGQWWDRGVGYTKFRDGWGIALRTREGDHYASPDQDSEELWRFTEAPRWMRIEAVSKLPDLLKALLKQAEETTKKIKTKIAQANEIAEAVRIAAQGTAPQGER